MVALHCGQRIHNPSGTPRLPGRPPVGGGGLPSLNFVPSVDTPSPQQTALVPPSITSACRAAVKSFRRGGAGGLRCPFPAGGLEKASRGRAPPLTWGENSRWQ